MLFVPKPRDLQHLIYIIVQFMVCENVKFVVARNENKCLY